MCVWHVERCRIVGLCQLVWGIRCWVVVCNDIRRVVITLSTLYLIVIRKKSGTNSLVVLFIFLFLLDWRKKRGRCSSAAFPSVPLIVHVPRHRATMPKRGGICRSLVFFRVGVRWRRARLLGTRGVRSGRLVSALRSRLAPSYSHGVTAGLSVN